MEIEKVSVPEGESEDWEITKMEVSAEEAAFDNMRARINGERRIPVKADTYTVLQYNGTPVMSDTPAELFEQEPIIRNAKGTILITGLGLGVSVNMCLKNPDVKKIFVIELSQDVINLVANHYLLGNEDRLEIINANALEWKPPKDAFYDAVWHDIWTNICIDNWDEMKKLHRRYARKCSWQDSWKRDLIRYLVRNDRWR